MGEDEARPRRPPSHELGQVLDDLSVAELAARIDQLRTEIARLELAMRAKQTARDEAGSVFGPRPKT